MCTGMKEVKCIEECRSEIATSLVATLRSAEKHNGRPLKGMLNFKLGNFNATEKHIQSLIGFK